METAATVVLFALDVFVAVTAIGGGVALLTGLERARFSTRILARTPFRSFVVPGLLLAVGVGGSAAFAAVSVIVDQASGGVASLIAGLVLAGFVAIEGWIIEEKPGYTVTEVIYLVGGVVVAALGALVWRAA